MPGADELVQEALQRDTSPEEVLNALILGMSAIGERFSAGKAFVPEMLMSAKAMSAGMTHLKPFFKTGQVKRKGKNLVTMTIGRRRLGSYRLRRGRKNSAHTGTLILPA